MGHVKGIGGLFFRARDPDALNAWYRERLGVGAGCNADDSGPVDEWSWMTASGPVVFAAFKADTDYFAADRQFMINLRVDDLDAGGRVRPGVRDADRVGDLAVDRDGVRRVGLGDRDVGLAGRDGQGAAGRRDRLVRPRGWVGCVCAGVRRDDVDA